MFKKIIIAILAFTCISAHAEKEPETWTDPEGVVWGLLATNAVGTKFYVPTSNGKRSKQVLLNDKVVIFPMMGVTKSGEGMYFAVAARPQDCANYPDFGEIYIVNVETQKKEDLLTYKTRMHWSVYGNPDKEMVQFHAGNMACMSFLTSGAL